MTSKFRFINKIILAFKKQALDSFAAGFGVLLLLLLGEIFSRICGHVQLWPEKSQQSAGSQQRGAMTPHNASVTTTNIDAGSVSATTALLAPSPLPPRNEFRAKVTQSEIQVEAKVAPNASLHAEVNPALEALGNLVPKLSVSNAMSSPEDLKAIERIGEALARSVLSNLDAKKAEGSKGALPPTPNIPTVIPSNGFKGSPAQTGDPVGTIQAETSVPLERERKSSAFYGDPPKELQVRVSTAPAPETKDASYVRPLERTDPEDASLTEATLVGPAVPEFPTSDGDSAQISVKSPNDSSHNSEDRSVDHPNPHKFGDASNAYKKIDAKPGSEKKLIYDDVVVSPKSRGNQNNLPRDDSRPGDVSTHSLNSRMTRGIARRGGEERIHTFPPLVTEEHPFGIRVRIRVRN